MSIEQIFHYYGFAVDSSGCHLWRGPVHARYGYGRFTHNRRKLAAHRVAYALRFGAVPEGKEVDHRCRNRLCVNAEHLRAVTHAENDQNLARKRPNSTGIRGVYFDATRQKFHAHVFVNGRSARKRFDTVEAADAWATATRNALMTHNDADRQQQVIERRNAA